MLHRKRPLPVTQAPHDSLRFSLHRALCEAQPDIQYVHSTGPCAQIEKRLQNAPSTLFVTSRRRIENLLLLLDQKGFFAHFLLLFRLTAPGMGRWPRIIVTAG